MKLNLIPLLALFAYLPCTADIYTWTDEDGNVHYADDRNRVQSAPVAKVVIKDEYAINAVEVQDPIPYQNDEPNRTVSLNTITLALEGSERDRVRIGRITCGDPIDIYWVEGHVDFQSPEVAEASVQVFVDNGYAARNEIGATTSPASLYLEAAIKAIKMNECPNRRVRNASQNASYLRIEWTLRDPLKNQVVYSTVTRGSHDALSKPPIKDGGTVSFGEAMAAATTNLLADQNFVAHLQPADIDSLINKFDSKLTIELDYGTGQGNFSTRVEDLKSNTAIVKTSGGHGSGVVVNDKGFILTNAHVVGDEQHFKILVNNREYDGQLVRKEDVRDVAVIRAPGLDGNGRGVKIAYAAPRTGDELYIIGTPLSLSNSQTVTKGIISAFRNVGNLPFLQTDAAINLGNSGGPVFNEHGELVALTVSGLFTNDGANLSINYLIPIDDALSKLSIDQVSHRNTVLDNLLPEALREAEQGESSTSKRWIKRAIDWLNSPLI